MTTSYSKLVYRRTEPLTPPATLTQTVIALHGKGGGHDDLIAFGRMISPALRIVTPEAGRSMYFGTMVTGHTWYGGMDLGQPEPASLGETLAQLERFVYDETERQAQTDAPRPILLGYEQGAVVALIAAEFFADRLGGVVAIGGARPEVVRWDVPQVDAAGCPVLIVHDPAEAFPTSAAVDTTHDVLAKRGAVVTIQRIEGGNRADETTAAIVRDWLATNTLG